MAVPRVEIAAQTEGGRWIVRLIGPFRVERGGGELCRVAGRRERILLAYLALAPEFRGE
jgi:DNA-binding SARP family transcriptional activator